MNLGPCATFFALVAASCFCFNAKGQQSGEVENRTPLPDDLIAYAEWEDGKPISGVEAKLEIKRTVGFFSGIGTPPIASRVPSNFDGELRFSNGTNWQDWIKAEIAAKNPKVTEPRDLTKEISEFRAYSWTVSGYWPRTNSRIKFTASGRPELWLDRNSVKLILPTLRLTRVRVTSKADGIPLANVRLWISQQLGVKNDDGKWDDVSAFAWTDSTGSAVVWLPNGSYDVRWDTTHSIEGTNAESELFKIRMSEFGEHKLPAPPRNVMGDQRRVAAFQRPAYWWVASQPPLQVSDLPPSIYQVEVEHPLTIVP